MNSWSSLCKLLSSACTGFGLTVLVLALLLAPSTSLGDESFQVPPLCNLCVGPCLATSNGACLGKACNPPPPPAAGCHNCSCADSSTKPTCECVRKLSPEDP